MWTAITQHISRVTGCPFEIQERRSLGGGSINQAYRLTDGDRDYFIKLNQANQYPMFEAEALGLEEISATQTIRVPKPLCWGTTESLAYLVLEYLPLGGNRTESWHQMGQDLAAMHRVMSDRGFGWKRDNTIGAIPQKNPWTPDWAGFFSQHRLAYQFQLAHRRGGHFPQREALLSAVTKLLAGHQPDPSLVHGDLWSGNAAVMLDGTPVILDPAVYYGDREVDLAMTELFGRFPQAFYEGYNAAYPLSPGYEIRKHLYNLYHLLNHFNLFGGGYASQVNNVCDRLLRSAAR
jgi:fructosamine-3-kinase